MGVLGSRTFETLKFGLRRAGDGSRTLEVRDDSGDPVNNSDLAVMLGKDAFVRPSGPLGTWKNKLISDPANAEMALVGDSTSDAHNAAGVIYRRLLGLHTQVGEALAGLGSGDYYTDGSSTNGSPTFTSASANFTQADVGRYVHGAAFPLSTEIVAVVNSTTVTLGANLTATATNVPFYVGRHIINGGNNGMTLSQWMATPSAAFPYNRDRLVADNPDLIVYSWLLNDIRIGGMGVTVDTIVPVGIARLQSLIDWTRATLPNSSILLRMPNPILTANVNNYNFVSDGVTVNAAGIAQIYTTALRRIYLYFVGKYPNVDVLDTHAEIFGTHAVSSHPLMADQLHPNVHTLTDVNNFVPVGGGYAAIADAIAARVGNKRAPFVPYGRRARAEFIVQQGFNGAIRLIARDAPDAPAAQAPAFKTDSMYILGYDSPVPLTNANIDRTFSPDIFQINNLTGFDLSGTTAKTCVIAGTHAPSSTGDRQQIFVDLPSIAAGATVDYDVAVPGVSSGNSGVAAAAIVAPANGFMTSGLRLLGSYVYANDQVRLVINNPTGSAIDRPGESWTFWVVR